MAFSFGLVIARSIQPLQVTLTRSFSLLKSHQLEKYHNDGVIVPEYQLPSEKLLKAQTALDQLLIQNPNISPELLVNSHLENSNSVAADERVKGNRYFLELASSTDIVNIVSQCLGTENVILWGCQIFCKPALIGKSVPYHQDGPYWPIKPLKAVSVWIALDDSNENTGNVKFISGSHKFGMIEHIQQIDDEACINYIADPTIVKELVSGHINEINNDVNNNHHQTTTTTTTTGSHGGSDKIISVELKAGEISIHDSLVVHGSGMNKSNQRRAGIAATFMAVGLDTLGFDTLSFSISPLNVIVLFSCLYLFSAIYSFYCFFFCVPYLSISRIYTSHAYIYKYFSLTLSLSLCCFFRQKVILIVILQLKVP